MLLMAAVITAVVGGMILALITLGQRQILRTEGERVDLIMSGMTRNAVESLNFRDDLMLLSYLRFQMKESPEIEICLVTKSGYTTVLGAIKGELEYRTVTAEAAGETVTVQTGFSKSFIKERQRRENTALMAVVMSIAVIGLVLGFAGALLMSRKLAGPVAELSAAADKLGRGDLEAAVTVQGADEISALGLSFNRMAANIRESVMIKEDLLNTLTHELNNPLAGLKAFIALLRSPVYIPTMRETREAYETMAVSVGQMELLLSNALELFKNSAKPSMDPGLVDVGALVREAISLYGPVARSKHIDLKFSVPERGLSLMADKKLLRRAVVNLLASSLKYTPEHGAVMVMAEDKEGAMELSVADTGYGISKEDQALLFTDFYKKRGSDGKKTKIPGSGLGLVIARKAVELHRGKIWVESGKNNGSVFRVSLPKLALGDFL